MLFFTAYLLFKLAVYALIAYCVYYVLKGYFTLFVALIAIYFLVKLV